MNRKTFILVLLGFVPGLSAGCGEPHPTEREVRFEGKRAFALLEHLCRFGPRAPGTESAREARTWLVNELGRYAPDVRELPFKGTDPPTKRVFDLANIFARLQPEKPRRILLVTHWDTRLWADLDPDPEKHDTPIIGANDGGSGVAVILELCRLFAERPPPVGVDVLLTDGEDLGRPGSRDYWQGSAHLAKLGYPVPGAMPVWAIVVDLVGDRDLQIKREAFSMKYHPELVERIWETASELGYGDQFVSGSWKYIKDDQVPLYEGLRIPGVLLIDFEYGPDHKIFHTVEDTVDKCSAKSLEVVGTVVAEVVYREKAE